MLANQNAQTNGRTLWTSCNLPGEEHLFPISLNLCGDIHNFIVGVNGQEIFFGPNEERNYGAVVDAAKQTGGFFKGTKN